MKKLSYILFFILLVTQICFTQVLDDAKIPKQTNEILPTKLPHPTHTHILNKSTISLHPSFYDRKAEWQKIIDSTWGLGEPLSGKLATFDLYQNFARSYNSTFLWNPINWDSLALSLRSKINDSTSRGGFARILNDLTAGMKDGHAHAYDDTVFFDTPLNPGTPILVDGSGYINHFGAGLTPLADSSLLVYKVVPNHPLGLEPGDIILGYEGVPWHQIVQELLDGNVPHSIWRAPAPSAYSRYLLESAGESWHLFDTIDVIKHSTGLTVHLPLDPMVTLVAPDYIINNEQIPIPGVPMPLGFFENHGAVTYGIIDGTNIGYIYIYHHQYQGVSAEFDNAVKALMQTDGLIIDIRVDWGGFVGLNTGISRLMNFQTYTFEDEKRCSPVNLYDLCHIPTQVGVILDDNGTYYDRPIAVLIGPGCVSYGDYTAWQLSYVPYARMFGRSPVAAYSGMLLYTQPSRPGFSLRCPDFTSVDHYFPNEQIWGHEFPKFEEVWLTPDGVANGEDDVVNRAVEWMNNLVFPHNVFPEKGYYAAGIDTAHIFSTIENPNSHQISARGYIKTFGGVLIDSVDFVHQLLNPSGELWVGSFDLPLSEEFYDVSVTSIDNTIGEEFPVPNATKFTTVPLLIDSLPVGIANNYKYTFKPFLKNAGSTYTLENIVVKLTSEDPWITDIFPAGGRGCPNLLPGEVKSVPAVFAVTFDPATFPNFADSGYFNLSFTISSNSLDYWRIDTLVYVPTYTDVEGELSLPLTFNLEQNFPNPFNPVTTIKYQIPNRSNVSLKIYDLLGNEVADLVNEEQEVGYYNIDFNAARHSSGVYFYRLQAGDFVQTRKMILLK